MKKHGITNHELSHQHALLTQHKNENLKANLILQGDRKETGGE